MAGAWSTSATLIEPTTAPVASPVGGPHHAFRRRSRRPVPRIERNAIASAKAITAARFAPRGDGSRVVSLDKVIETACETGRDMRVLEC